MTAAAIDRVPQGGADQSYRIALRVRLNQPRAAVHKLDAHRFDPDRGHVYKATCGAVLSAARGAMRTTYEVSCQHCISPSLSGEAAELVDRG